MSVGVTRKLFIDSRFKVSGTDSDFLIELPVDVDCTRTSSFFVASCSFANTFATVMKTNNLFYFIVDDGLSFPSIYVAAIPEGSYTPATMGPVLAAALAPLNITSTWTFNTVGTYTVTYTSAGLKLFVPNYTEIDSFVSRLHCLDGTFSPFVGYSAATPKYLSVNAMLNMQLSFPTPIYGSAFNTGILDLTSLKEVYLHNSLANNRTLHVNGSRDCIARIPIDVSLGEVVQYRYLGPTEALSCSDMHFRTIRFQLRDWAGNIAPLGSFIAIELSFLDSDPYSA